MSAATPAKVPKAKPTNHVKVPLPSAGLASTQGIVVVKVGPEGVQHHVHKALLIHHSEYFRNALTGPWTEAQEQVITLDDIEPSTFTLFVHWLYHQGIPTSREDWVRMSLVPDTVLWLEDSLHICIQAYSFGDRFAVLAFSRASNNVFAENDPTRHYFKHGGFQSLIYAFKNIPSDRVILQRLVDWYSQCWDVRSYQFDADQLAKLSLTFLRRFTQRLNELKTMNMAERLKKRCYLEHASDEEKKECEALHMRYDEKYCIARYE